jgi:polysaccharide biosynthesis protein PelC
MLKRAFAAGLVAVLFAGCGSSHREGVFHDPNMDFSLVQTVAVMPFSNLTSVTSANERVRNIFMTMLQATGGVYVVPPGEVARGVSRSNVTNPLAPTAEEVVNLGKNVKADVVITGSLLEYGELRSGSTAANVISMTVQMLEAQTGKVVWSASSTQGGVKTSDRLFGGGGEPMDIVTEKAVKDLLDKLYRVKK